MGQDPQVIRAEIADTHDRIADTADAIASADVKSPTGSGSAQN
jgi:hypothetical protein